MSLLLDFPWHICDAIGDGHVAAKTMLDFVNLVRRTRQDPVPFLGIEEYGQYFGEFAGWRSPDRVAVYGLVQSLIYQGQADCVATLDPEPVDLRIQWKSALGDCLKAGDWRIPQIVIPAQRRPEWPAGDTVTVKNHCPAEAIHECVAVTLERYDDHRFAWSDWDPWDLRRVYPHARAEARLPKPPRLNDCRFSDLAKEMQVARSEGWCLDGKFYYIPAETFDVEKVPSHQWRKGNTFPLGLHDKDSFPIDEGGRIWVWDPAHGHWDVQLSTGYYQRVDAKGADLGRKKRSRYR